MHAMSAAHVSIAPSEQPLFFMSCMRSYLVLAFMCTLLMYFFYHAFLNLNFFLAGIFAIFVSFTASLPRLTAYSRQIFPLVVVLIVSWILVLMMGFTMVLAKIERWDPVRSSVVGALCGGLLSLGTFGVAELVWACNRRAERREERSRI
eukprot:evm.model.scf_187.5 EVM.evm.TU.scf_187.5   scf_187:122690-124370(-)